MESGQYRQLSGWWVDGVDGNEWRINKMDGKMDGACIRGG